MRPFSSTVPSSFQSNCNLESYSNHVLAFILFCFSSKYTYPQTLQLWTHVFNTLDRFQPTDIFILSELQIAPFWLVSVCQSSFDTSLIASLLFACQNIPGSSSMFPVLDLESAISLRSPSLNGKGYFNIRMLSITRLFIVSRPVQWTELGYTNFLAFIDLYT